MHDKIRRFQGLFGSNTNELMELLRQEHIIRQGLSQTLQQLSAAVLAGQAKSIDLAPVLKSIEKIAKATATKKPAVNTPFVEIIQCH